MRPRQWQRWLSIISVAGGVGTDWSPAPASAPLIVCIRHPHCLQLNFQNYPRADRYHALLTCQCKSKIHCILVQGCQGRLPGRPEGGHQEGLQLQGRGRHDAHTLGRLRGELGGSQAPRR